MRAWGRMIFLLGVLWLLTRWLGFGYWFNPDARTIALWASILLALFLLWRDGRVLLARYGWTAADQPLALLEGRLARGEIDLEAYRSLRAELLAEAGITSPKKNTEPKRVLRNSRRA